MQRKLGVNVNLIDRVELRELEPDWKVDEVEPQPTNPILVTATEPGWPTTS